MKPLYIYRLKETFCKIGIRWERLSPKISEANEYAYKHINKEPSSMKDHQHYFLAYCLAHSGETINTRLRNDNAEKIDKEIAAMVSSHRTDVDLILYRGVCEHVYNLMVENARGRANCDFYEKGFMATSLVKGNEIKSKIRLRIYVPAGSKVVFMGNVNEEPDFYEVDIMHGAMLKIVSVDNTYINCKLLGTD